MQRSPALVVIGGTTASGNPLLFQPHNQSKANKLAINSVSTESIYVRAGNPKTWLKANKPTFDNVTAFTANSTFKTAITLTANDGTTGPAFMGYTTFNLANGGDFGITQSPDAVTCNGQMQTTGFDHHNTTYRMLNCQCSRQYLGSYSALEADNDAGYDAFLGFGSWTTSNTCGMAGGEGGLEVAAVGLEGGAQGVQLGLLEGGAGVGEEGREQCEGALGVAGEVLTFDALAVEAGGEGIFAGPGVGREQRAAGGEVAAGGVVGGGDLGAAAGVEVDGGDGAALVGVSLS